MPCDRLFRSNSRLAAFAAPKLSARGETIASVWSQARAASATPASNWRAFKARKPCSLCAILLQHS